MEVVLVLETFVCVCARACESIHKEHEHVQIHNLIRADCVFIRGESGILSNTPVHPQEADVRGSIHILVHAFTNTLSHRNKYVSAGGGREKSASRQGGCGEEVEGPPGDDGCQRISEEAQGAHVHACMHAYACACVCSIVMMATSEYEMGQRARHIFTRMHTRVWACLCILALVLS